LLDHVDQKDINLSSIEILVLDEADTMCDMGFLPDVRRILGHIPAKRQTLFFSATMPSEIRSLAVSILKDPLLVQIGAIAPAKTVSHALYPVPDTMKKRLLLALLEQTSTGRALVFTRTKHRARTLALDLAKNSYRVAALQGNMSQNARQRAMTGFRDGKIDILVATDIAAHGIDVPEISHVINFDFPGTADTYTHRIGRTGRAEQTGEAFTLAGAADGPMVREVEKELGARIERRRLPGFNYGDFIPEAQFPDQRPAPANRIGSNDSSQNATRNNGNYGRGNDNRGNNNRSNTGRAGQKSNGQSSNGRSGQGNRSRNNPSFLGSRTASKSSPTAASIDRSGGRTGSSSTTGSGGTTTPRQRVRSAPRRPSR
jgi:ATP-dependent RNA helicase RhlE